MLFEQTSQNSGKWANKTSEFAKIKSLLNTLAKIYGYIFHSKTWPDREHRKAILQHHSWSGEKKIYKKKDKA